MVRASSLWLLCAALVVAGCATSPMDTELARYATLRGHKAFAVGTDASGRHAYGIGAGARTSQRAASLALSRCEAMRHNNDIAAVCDIVRLDDAVFESGDAMLRRIDGRNPELPALAWHVRGPRADAYVLGSIHVLKPSLLPLPDVYQQAYEAADTVVVEVSGEDPAKTETLRFLRRHARLHGGARLRDVVPVPLYEAVISAPLVDRKILRRTARMTPSQFALDLRRAAYQVRGYLPHLGIESQLLARARAGGKPVVGLDDFARSLREYHTAALETQVQSLAGTMAEIDDPHGIDRIVEAFWRADAEALMLVTGNRAALEHERMRNLHMAARITDLLASGDGVYLVLVGAGHLPGDGGLIRQLQARGLAATQLNRAGTPITRSLAGRERQPVRAANQ